MNKNIIKMAKFLNDSYGVTSRFIEGEKIYPEYTNKIDTPIGAFTVKVSYDTEEIVGISANVDQDILYKFPEVIKEFGSFCTKSATYEFANLEDFQRCFPEAVNDFLEKLIASTKHSELITQAVQQHLKTLPNKYVSLYGILNPTDTTFEIYITEICREYLPKYHIVDWDSEKETITDLKAKLEKIQYEPVEKTPTEAPIKINGYLVVAGLIIVSSILSFLF